MTAFRNLPIRRKLLLLTLASSATALVLASGGFLAWDISQFRSEMQQDTDAQAAIVADNSAAPLTFNDRQAAGETLAVMRLRPRVVMACLYDANGRAFASYLRARGTRCPAAPPAAETRGWTAYATLTPVTLSGKPIGTLYILRDLDDLASRLRVGAAAVAGFLLIALAVAFLVARGIERTIAGPLLALADTARAISTGRDDSIRAEAASGDEVGTVIEAFNAMLDRIEQRNRELSRTNAELAREIVERRRVEKERTAALERERDANRLKDEFLATLSHELRTPLGAVLGWVRVLQTARGSEEKIHARALEVIERNARAQAHLIEDLLEISRIGTGKLTLKVRTVDLAEIVDAAVEVMRPAAAAKQIALRTEISGRPALTSGDPDRLQQIVWNLVSNAVKFTPPGGAATVRLTQNSGFRIEVTDTGQGIDPRFLPHVFDAFRQADGTPTREHGGLGLGLAIARQLAELHGGTITAQSEGVGRGSTFRVELPSVMPSSPAAPDGSRQPAPAPPMAGLGADLLRGVHVLVVDDQADARELLETALSQYGAAVTAVDSASAALAAIDRQHPDVLLSDVGMPREDGYELIRRLRSRPAEAGGAIPAIAVTAYASINDRAAALASGYQAHVAKPFDPEELVQVIANLRWAGR
jgi:signal transduction histidine kinase/CheY-like chemotaxis protein